MQSFKVASNCTEDTIALAQLDVGRAEPPLPLLLLLFVLLLFNTYITAAPQKLS